MRIRKQTPDVVSSVQDQTTQAEDIARIAGQDRLSDPRTNPAVRPHADRLRDVQHRMALDAEHGRTRRRHRVEDRRASHAEKSLEALQEAREASSSARSVLALHASRVRYMRLSLATSVVLAFGSARGLEHLAGEYKNIPKGSGYIAEIGLTGLATVVILAKSDLAQHGGKVKAWQDVSLWALMVTPLAASMVANVYGGNVIGAICAAGAAAFAFFSFIVATVFAVSARSQAEKVTGEDESSLRGIAIGDDLFSTRIRGHNPAGANTGANGSTTTGGHSGGHKATGGHQPQGANAGANKRATVPGPRLPQGAGATNGANGEGHNANPKPVETVAPQVAPPVGPDVAPANNDGGKLIEFSPRGETQAAMRGHWDSRIRVGQIPTGADLNRAVGKDPKYSLGKKYARAWREDLPAAFVEAVDDGRTDDAVEIAQKFAGGADEEVGS